jgi:hypothetical protein
VRSSSKAAAVPSGPIGAGPSVPAGGQGGQPAAARAALAGRQAGEGQGAARGTPATVIPASAAPLAPAVPQSKGEEQKEIQEEVRRV